MMMQMKKHSSCADVRCESAGRSISLQHCLNTPPTPETLRLKSSGRYQCLGTFSSISGTHLQMQAANARIKTAMYAPYMPHADLIKTGKLMPYLQPTYPLSMARMQARRCPVSTAILASPELKPCVIEDEASNFVL
jgi:hypothetical protein